jgi:transposase
MQYGNKGHQSQIKYKDGGVKMKGIPQGRYTKEFCEEAVKMVKDGGMSLPEAARRLSLIEMELSRTNRELAEVKMELEILKKAAAYFAKESGD